MASRALDMTMRHRRTLEGRPLTCGRCGLLLPRGTAGICGTCRGHASVGIVPCRRIERELVGGAV